jgi:preprotein translocase subunit Sec63
MTTKKRDYYEVLGVPRGASEEEIKKAFNKKVDVATEEMIKPIIYNFVQRDLINV